MRCAHRPRARRTSLGLPSRDASVPRRRPPPCPELRPRVASNRVDVDPVYSTSPRTGRRLLRVRPGLGRTTGRRTRHDRAVPDGSQPALPWTTRRVHGSTTGRAPRGRAERGHVLHRRLVVISTPTRATSAAGSFSTTSPRRTDLPQMIGVFVDPGCSTSTGSRRSTAAEYDAFDNTYASFRLDEVLADSGERYAVSKDPMMRGSICGEQQRRQRRGHAAWTRPDGLGRAVAFNPSFAQMPGGNPLPSPPHHGAPPLDQVLPPRSPPRPALERTRVELVRREPRHRGRTRASRLRLPARRRRRRTLTQPRRACSPRRPPLLWRSV